MKIVALTGAGISAPSGLRTFRDANGLWENHRVEDVATPEAWARDPSLVLRFYNERRSQLGTVRPNAGNLELAAWEKDHEVVVITQNVDDLHERAGSSKIIHLHGRLTQARSTLDDSLVIDIGYAPIRLGDRCPRGSQLRPHIVWFGEDVPAMDAAIEAISDADCVVVAGTSLQVYPAAGLVNFAPATAGLHLVDPHPGKIPPRCRIWRESADVGLPALGHHLHSKS